jgi:parallel beta-helix repeat protein
MLTAFLALTSVFLILFWQPLQEPQVLAAGKTYYVATSGSDANFGTADGPWRTIQHAANRVQAGDQVVVRAGIYEEKIVMKASGTIDQPIIFEGERGSSGEWLTVIDASRPLTATWTLVTNAPFVASDGVYKTTAIPHNTGALVVLIDGQYKHIPKISDKLMEGVSRATAAQSKTRGEMWYDILRRGANQRKEYAQGQNPDRTPRRLAVNVWDGIDAYFGSRCNDNPCTATSGFTTYLRFRNADDPNTKNLRFAPLGPAVRLENTSYITLKNLEIRNGQDGIRIAGAHHNVIEGNYVTSGRHRIEVYSGASSNHIRKNKLQRIALSPYLPGAWGADSGGVYRYSGNALLYQYAVREHMYHEYKGTVGGSVGGGDTNDRSIRLLQAGADNAIYENQISQGGLGITVQYSSNIRIYKNEVSHHQSVCIALLQGTNNIWVNDNLLYDCNIIFRPNRLEEGNRLVYIYRNRLYNPDGVGQSIFAHATPTSRSECAAASGTPPEFWIYHNSLAGGRYGFLSGQCARMVGALSRFRFINNIFSSSKAWHILGGRNEAGTINIFDYNWLGGEWQTAPWFGTHNVNAQHQFLWDNQTLPNFQLPAGSTARNAGIDLSQSFTIGGRTYGPLPGFSPGYAGPDGRPDLGAVQSGEACPAPHCPK